jgi:23S rRNA (cytidine2498-2'-O)-methyltransferase
VKLNEKHVFVAAEKYKEDLESEISFRKDLRLLKNEENLYWVEGKRLKLWWPQWQLWNIQQHKFDSISQAVKFLKSIGRNWVNLDFKLHRRSSLIQESLPKVKTPNFERGNVPELPQCGAWFLLDDQNLCYSLNISLPYRNGIIPVPEDRQAPSRAFQKLDEVFIRIGQAPMKSERVIDLGSHPGGWTWVLSHLAREVVSVDTVPLDKKLDQLKNITFIKKDAFKLNPSDIGPVDWLFSDIICEPARLLTLVRQWNDMGLVKNFVCTIKFKGKVDFEILKQFSDFPNSEIFHLNANKHELTWAFLKQT